MNKIIFLVLILVVQFLRYAHSNFRSGEKLFVSFYVISIPFQFALPIFTPNLKSSGGTLGVTVSLLLPLVLYVILILTKKPRFRVFEAIRYKWAVLLSVIGVISILNPFNNAPISTISFAVFFLSHTIFLAGINSAFSKGEIFKGIYDGFFFLSVIQLILAICFPVLQLSFVTKIFYSAAEGWATRNGTRLGAVGTFTHPGNLALFSVIAASFFFSCYISKFRAKWSLIVVIMCSATIFLTYSRTTYLTYVFIIIAIYFLHGNPNTALFSVVNILKIILPSAILLTWLIFYSPISDVFLNSDVDSMFAARFSHWLIGLNTFKASPIIGVGLNAHLEYFANNNFSLSSVAGYNQFLLSNPIHNIHLIILAETGIIGFSCWLIFIVKSIVDDKADLAAGKNVIYSLTHIGTIGALVIYGITGWAPLSPGILPFLLLFTFQTTSQREYFRRVAKFAKNQRRPILKDSEATSTLTT